MALWISRRYRSRNASRPPRISLLYPIADCAGDRIDIEIGASAIGDVGPNYRYLTERMALRIQRLHLEFATSDQPPALQLDVKRMISGESREQPDPVALPLQQEAAVGADATILETDLVVERVGVGRPLRPFAQILRRKRRRGLEAHRPPVVRNGQRAERITAMAVVSAGQGEA